MAVESMDEIHSLKSLPSKSTRASEGIFVRSSTETTLGFGSQISVAAGFVGSFCMPSTSIILGSFVLF
jgi:hypothetical protein